MTEWRTIPSNPKYVVSDDGRVRHRASDKDRKLHPNGSGYLLVNFWQDKKLRMRTVHSLIAEAFLGPRPEGMQVRHLDGDRHNNCASNLAYGSGVENAADRDGHGKTMRGQRNGNARLPDSDVEMLRLIHMSGKANQYELAALFRISQAQVNNIVLNKQRKRAA